MKNDVITYLCLESNQSLKNEAITLKFGLDIHYTWFSYIYSGFLDTFEIFNFWGKFLKKSVFLDFGGSKTQNFGNPKLPSCRKLNFLSYSVLRLRFASKLCFATMHQTFIVIQPKMAWHDVIKTSLSSKVLNLFRWFF